MYLETPDAVCTLTDRNKSHDMCCAVEVKTMTASSTIKVAKETSQRHYPFIFLPEIGLRKEDTKLFHDIISTASYRSQCLHHVSTLETRYVIYVVAKGLRGTEGSILYVALLDFSLTLRRNYIFALDCI